MDSGDEEGGEEGGEDEGDGSESAKSESGGATAGCGPRAGRSPPRRREGEGGDEPVADQASPNGEVTGGVKELLPSLDRVQTFSEFVRLVPDLQSGVGGLDSQHLVTLCKAAARVKYFDGELFADVFRYMVPKIRSEEMSPVQMMEVVQCLVELNACDGVVLAAAAVALTPKVAEMEKAQRLKWLSLLGDAQAKSPPTEAFADALRSAPVAEDNLPAVSSSGRIACRHYARGFCALGKSCTFSHEAGLVPPPTSNPLVLTQMQQAVIERNATGGGGGSARPSCRHFQRGLCTLGSTCNFRHADAPHVVPPPRPPARPAMPVRTTSKVCIHHAAGNCSWGSKCHFLHVVSGQAFPT